MSSLKPFEYVWYWVVRHATFDQGRTTDWKRYNGNVGKGFYRAESAKKSKEMALTIYRWIAVIVFALLGAATGETEQGRKW